MKVRQVATMLAYVSGAILSTCLEAHVAYAAPASHETGVVRSTLANGLRVVILRNTLAPVVTVETNFLVGGDETPTGFPGMAHAQEHMAFRGCKGMTADQTAAIYAQLGGNNNADTQQNITQYYATVPAADLDVALEAQASCLRDVEDSEAEWAQERGAIEQEVAMDLSNPTYKFISRLNEDLFAGTAYSHDPLGTKESFDRTTGAMLKDFYRKWYSPSNAILVVAGDIDPTSTLRKIRSLFGDIPKRPTPSRPTVNLQPVKAESFTLDSNLPYVLGFIAYRLPGTDSPDYAAAQILVDVLSSQRGDLYAMVPDGKSLAAEFGLAETYPKASVGYGLVAQPVGVDPAASLAEMRQIIARYAERGLPAELIEAAKRGEIAQAEFQRNSIPGLANLWSNAMAAEGRRSPDEDVDAIRRVSVADVNRVARRYLRDASSITATLKPVPTGEPVASKGFGGGEQVTTAPSKPVQLPDWAAVQLNELKVPESYIQASNEVLPNGVRLIVRTDRTSPTVTVLGSIRHEAGLETPVGQEGISRVLEGLYSYGTTTLDRLAFQKALDDIAAQENAGYTFSLAVLKNQFSRGVQLLADNELHPALPESAFAVVQRQMAQELGGSIKSPAYQMHRTLERALLPANDPAVREALPETVSKLTLDDVRRYQVATVRPDLTTIVVIGDVSPAEAREVIEKWFGSWRSVGPKPATELPPVPMNQASATNVPDSEQVQDDVTLAEELSINRFDPQYYALQLGTHVLGGGFYATRLYHDLRQVSGYVYSVDVALSASKTRARYSVSYGCNPENISKARVLIERDLNQMRNELVSPAELRQAKALLLRQIPLSESSEESVAAGMLARSQIGLPLDEPVRAAKTYSALTAEEVRAAFAKSISTDHLVQVVRGTRATVSNTLRRTR